MPVVVTPKLLPTIKSNQCSPVLSPFCCTDAVKPSPAAQAQSISEVYFWHPRDIPWQLEAGSSARKLHPVVCCVNRSCCPVSQGTNCVVLHFSSSVRCGLWHYLLTFLTPFLSCFTEECSRIHVIVHETVSFSCFCSSQWAIFPKRAGKENYFIL